MHSCRQQRSRDLDTDRKRLQETLQREVETRKRVDKMLQGYKDEASGNRHTDGTTGRGVGGKAFMFPPPKQRENNRTK